MPRPVAVHECRNCHGWGQLDAGDHCPPCKVFARTAIRDVCRRCGHDELVNRNELCRLCLLTLRTVDKTWLADPQPRQPTQLFLLISGLSLPNARGLHRRPSPRRLLPPRNPGWVCAALDRPVADDPTICPPLPSGQQMLFTPWRTLTLALAQRITERQPAGYPAAEQVIRMLAEESNRSVSWRQRVSRMVGLVLAAAEADGRERIPHAELVDLESADSVIELLRRTGRLQPWTGSGPLPRRAPARPPSRMRSCAECDCWGPDAICGGCRRFRAAHPLGRCTRCRRIDLPVSDRLGSDQLCVDRLCRSCTIVLRDLGPDAPPDGSTQLSLGGPFAPRLRNHGRKLGYEPTRWKARDLAMRRRPAPPPVSPHLVDPVQPELFIVRRDWSVLTDGTTELPSLTPAAAQIIDDVQQAATAARWHPDAVRDNVKTLRILLGWLGAEAPIAEEDIRALTATISHTTSGRVLSLLEERGLLIPAASRAASADQRWVERHIAQLPDPIGDELRIWVRVMRGDGRRRRRLRSWTVIRNYLYTTLPTLREWSNRHTSLRDVTEADARAAVQRTTGTTAQTQRTGLRSIFTALKQERVIFRDPTRSIVLGQVDNLPTGLRDDQLRGLIDRADGALQRLVVALVAIHAIGTEELRALTVDGVDTARGTLEVPRRGRFHTVYLDEVTLRLMLDWRRQRRERWPNTTNPHLLITNHGAFALDTPPVASATTARLFHQLGLQPRHVRSDRLLHEATITQDPVHLMRVFGVSAATAMRYLHAAHPERGAVPPR